MQTEYVIDQEAPQNTFLQDFSSLSSNASQQSKGDQEKQTLSQAVLTEMRSSWHLRHTRRRETEKADWRECMSDCNTWVGEQ